MITLPNQDVILDPASRAYTPWISGSWHPVRVGVYQVTNETCLNANWEAHGWGHAWWDAGAAGVTMNTIWHGPEGAAALPPQFHMYQPKFPPRHYGPPWKEDKEEDTGYSNSPQPNTGESRGCRKKPNRTGAPESSGSTSPTPMRMFPSSGESSMLRTPTRSPISTMTNSSSRFR
jgi:hypothetical protein